MFERAERRRLAKEAKKKKSATYNLTQEQLDAYVTKTLNTKFKDIEKQVFDDAQKRIYEIMVGIPALVVHDKFDFTPAQTQQFIRYILEQIEYIGEGYYTQNDLAQTLSEEIGIHFEDDIIELLNNKGE